METVRFNRCTGNAVGNAVDLCQFHSARIDVAAGDFETVVELLQDNADDPIPAPKIKQGAMEIFFCGAFQQNLGAMVDTCLCENAIIRSERKNMPGKPERMRLPVFRKVAVVSEIMRHSTTSFHRA